MIDPEPSVPTGIMEGNTSGSSFDLLEPHFCALEEKDVEQDLTKWGDKLHLAGHCRCAIIWVCLSGLVLSYSHLLLLSC